MVLTFDDGPKPGSTPRVLEALKHECVKASFFLLGRSAAAHPDLARRELDDGHTVAHHSFAHPLLNRMSASAAEAESDRGFAAVDTALYGKAAAAPATPFFRFPGFASSPVLLDRLDRRATGWTLAGLEPTGGDITTAALPPASERAAVRTWLADAAPGETRMAAARFDAVGLPRFSGLVAVRGVRPGRAVLAFAIDEDDAPSAVDTEMALLGLSCSCLAGEGQGATLIGSDLGPPDARPRELP